MMINFFLKTKRIEFMAHFGLVIVSEGLSRDLLLYYKPQSFKPKQSKNQHLFVTETYRERKENSIYKDTSSFLSFFIFLVKCIQGIIKCIKMDVKKVATIKIKEEEETKIRRQPFRLSGVPLSPTDFQFFQPGKYRSEIANRFEAKPMLNRNYCRLKNSIPYRSSRHRVSIKKQILKWFPELFPLTQTKIQDINPPYQQTNFKAKNSGTDNCRFACSDRFLECRQAIIFLQIKTSQNDHERSDIIARSGIGQRLFVFQSLRLSDEENQILMSKLKQFGKHNLFVIVCANPEELLDFSYLFPLLQQQIEFIYIVPLYILSLNFSDAIFSLKLNRNILVFQEGPYVIVCSYRGLLQYNQQGTVSPYFTLHDHILTEQEQLIRELKQFSKKNDNGAISTLINLVKVDEAAGIEVNIHAKAKQVLLHLSKKSEKIIPKRLTADHWPIAGKGCQQCIVCKKDSKKKKKSKYICEGCTEICGSNVYCCVLCTKTLHSNLEYYLKSKIKRRQKNESLIEQQQISAIQEQLPKKITTDEFLEKTESIYLKIELLKNRVESARNLIAQRIQVPYPQTNRSFTP